MYVKNLKTLYMLASKHSQYQALPTALGALLGELPKTTKFDRERLSFIAENVPLEKAVVLDIGGNTGYFSFESLSLGARHVDYVEGDSAHAEFVSVAGRYLELEERINIFNNYYDFDQSLKKRYDVSYLMNVVHHFGDDYGDPKSDISKAKKLMLSNLNSLSKCSQYLVFQMGFCWKGERSSPLFELGLKSEMIGFIKAGVEEFWEVEKIGVAEKVNNKVVYRDCSNENIARDDSLGEFLNRPIFILKSKVQQNIS
ncbi:class I SAM-dependent methyltransferase [Salinicola salarius]|uniref:class I SAM-dependent methyltransferase n=1 Tax=Salinicola salarius TaxID=430457 RepID=UPI0013009B0E|nr:class I SAM-dependent methyltransferase [Salinicola salarius]